MGKVKAGKGQEMLPLNKHLGAIQRPESRGGRGEDVGYPVRSLSNPSRHLYPIQKVTLLAQFLN